MRANVRWGDFGTSQERLAPQWVWHPFWAAVCPTPVLYTADFQGTDMNQAEQSKLISMGARERKFPKAPVKIPTSTFSIFIYM